LLTDDITFRHRTVADADGILGRHFTQWCAKFKIFPLDMGYGTESGYAAYPAHAVTESDGTVWLTALDSFEESGIRGNVEENKSFRSMLIIAAALPDRAPDGIALLIAGQPYQVIFQNTEAAGGDHIINVVFVRRAKIHNAHVSPPARAAILRSNGGSRSRG
jgi:hypothetical protein